MPGLTRSPESSASGKGRGRGVTVDDFDSNDLHEMGTILAANTRRMNEQRLETSRFRRTIESLVRAIDSDPVDHRLDPNAVETPARARTRGIRLMATDPETVNALGEEAAAATVVPDQRAFRSRVVSLD
jgi:hypothetical protein